MISMYNYVKQRGLSVLSSITRFYSLSQPVKSMNSVNNPIVEDEVSFNLSSKFSVAQSDVVTVSRDYDKEVAVCDVEENDLVCRLKSLFQEFPQSSQLTPVLVLYHTNTNMSVWSYDSHSEREKILKAFTQISLSVTKVIKAEGYWCDFIDPTSGMPYHGSYSNETFTECDEDFYRLSESLSLEDIGCCRALRHEDWGFNVFAGLLITNAPKELAIEVYQSTDHFTISN
jgi:hypothetical protein